jgi:ATP-dependent Clp protease adapter protein ClpS
MRPEIVLGLLATMAFLYLYGRSGWRTMSAPASGQGGERPEPRRSLAFGADANMVFYAARFETPEADDVLEPEHLLACALYDPRLFALVRARGVALETARQDALASARHSRRDAADAGDLHAGESYNDAPMSLRALVSCRRSHEIAEARGADEISLGDLLRALRERGGLFAELLPAGDPDPLDALDAPRVVTGIEGAPSGDLTPYRKSAGDVDVYTVNDDETSMDAVLSVLMDRFGLPPSRAAYAMLETHEKGHGYVGRFAPTEARERIARAETAARERGMPLRFVVAAAPPAVAHGESLGARTAT